MRRCMLLCILAAVFLPALALPDDDLSAFRRAQINAWMDSTGISRDFAILRIGPGPHPVPELAIDFPDLQHLELRFIAGDLSGKAAYERFQQLLAAYQASHDTTLPEKVFYEFIQTFSLGRRQACVDFHVLETIYHVYVSQESSQLVVREEPKRGDPQHFSLTIPVAVPKEQFRVHPANARTQTAEQVRDSIEKILDAYFIEANRAKGLGTPDITPVREDGYLGLKVEKVKGLVTDRFWEWLSINIEFHSDPAAPAAQQPLWKFGCYLDVKYASSPNEKSPSDADSDYVAQVVKLRSKLVDQLQQKLERGNQ